MTSLGQLLLNVLLSISLLFERNLHQFEWMGSETPLILQYIKFEPLI